MYLPVVRIVPQRNRGTFSVCSSVSFRPVVGNGARLNLLQLMMILDNILSIVLPCHQNIINLLIRPVAFAIYPKYHAHNVS